MDHLYTSIPIAEWLLTKNITCIGTMPTRRVGIPEEIKTTRNRELFSTRVFWEKKKRDLNITSYVVPTSYSVRNVLVLKPTRPLLGVTKDDGKKKPAIIKLYDLTKGGTDEMDQQIGKYTTKAT